MSTNVSPLALQPGQFGPGEAAAKPDRRIRVLIADDHPAVLGGVRRLLDEQPDMRIVTEATDAIGAVTGTATACDVAVIDYHLGDRNGLWVTRRLRQLVPPPRVLIYSAFTDEALAIAAVVAGADGLLSKSSIGEELCVAIRRLAAGHRYLPSISASVTRAMSARLDPRQQAIVAMLVHGISPEQITARLPISTPQLETQQTAILAILAPAATRARQRRRHGGHWIMSVRGVVLVCVGRHTRARERQMKAGPLIFAALLTLAVVDRRRQLSDLARGSR